MNAPVEPQDDDIGAARREVRAAWRELGDAEPGAALDARVRAAVAAELARGKGRQRVARWTPWAAAASVLLATGLGYRAWREATPMAAIAPASGPVPAPVPAETVTADAIAQPPPAARVEASRLAQATPSPAAPPPIARKELSEHKELSIESGLVSREAGEPVPSAGVPVAAPAANDMGSLEEVIVSPPARRTPVGSQAPYAGQQGARARDSAAAPPAPPPEWIEARRLLAAGETARATDIIVRWRARHADVALPDDLARLVAGQGH